MGLNGHLSTTFYFIQSLKIVLNLLLITSFDLECFGLLINDYYFGPPTQLDPPSKQELPPCG